MLDDTLHQIRDQVSSVHDRYCVDLIFVEQTNAAQVFKVRYHFLPFRLARVFFSRVYYGKSQIYRKVERVVQ